MYLSEVDRAEAADVLMAALNDALRAGRRHDVREIFDCLAVLGGRHLDNAALLVLQDMTSRSISWRGRTPHALA